MVGLRLLGSVIGLNGSAIGKGLRQSPRALAMTTAAAVVILPLTLLLTTPSGQNIDTGRGIYYTLATIACLYLGLMATHLQGTAGALGFRWVPKQGWLFWLWVTAALCVVQLVVVVMVLKFFPIILGRPEALGWHRFLTVCLVSPVAEEILYRMLLCPPAAALTRSWGGVIISGVVFASAHYFAGVATADNLIGGFFLAWLFVKSETILVPIALHSISNLILVICIGTLAPGVMPSPPVPADKKHAAEEKGIKSISIDVATSMTFVNQTQQTIKVYWLDRGGQRELFATLKAGDSHKIEPTYLMHAWLITDENDRAWYVYFPDAQPRTVEIVAPAK
jgi:membrane protease YdiL (CAAX protease family)